MFETKRIVSFSLKLIALGLLICISTSFFYQVFNLEKRQVYNYDEVVDSFVNIEVDASSNGFDVKIVAEGDEFRVEATDVTSKNFGFNVVNDRLVVRGAPERRWGIFSFDSNLINFPGSRNNAMPKVVIYVPEGSEFKGVMVKNGVGMFGIDGLKVDDLDISSGIGEFDVRNTEIEFLVLNCGIGSVKFRGVEINGSRIDGGIGELLIDGKLSGNNHIRTGIGSLVMNLDNDIESIRFNVDKGIGNVRMNGESGVIRPRSEEAVVTTYVDIEVGIGDVRITTR